MCCFNLTEAARDHSFDRNAPIYHCVELCLGLKYEQETFFSYRSWALIDDGQSGLCVVVYMEGKCRASLCCAISSCIHRVKAPLCPAGCHCGGTLVGYGDVGIVGFARQRMRGPRNV